MMDQFYVQYIPGGMGLDHSAWWLYCRHDAVYSYAIKMLRRADYK